MDGLLAESHSFVKSLQIQDYTIQEKIIQQSEILGYVDITTNKEEDRRRLLVSELRALKSKQNGEVWGYAIFTRSIGTGKSARLTVRAQMYNANPFKDGDIIYAQSVSKNKSGYWYLDKHYVDY